MNPFLWPLVAVAFVLTVAASVCIFIAGFAALLKCVDLVIGWAMKEGR